jgi:photosystem II stability/assembly factor-like uncharacterized protein
MKYSMILALLMASGWQFQPTNTRASFRGLSVVDDKLAWVSGSRATILKTTNGGETWTLDSIAGKATLDLRDIHAFDDRSAVTISAGEAEKGAANIFRTTDGGASWSVVYTTDQKGVFFDAISFWDRQHGIVMSDPIDSKLYLLETSDGGVTWARIPAENFPSMLPGEAAFAASGTCLIVEGKSNAWIATGGASVARVFRSTDRGHSWSVAETPIHSGDNGAAGIFSVAFNDGRHGVAVGGNYSQPRTAYPNVALSDDGGATWRLAAGATPPGYLSAVTYVPGSKGRTLVATGLVGTAVSSDGGQSWTMADTATFNAVSFVSRGTGFAAGDRGKLAKWSGSVDVAVPIRKP